MEDFLSEYMLLVSKIIKVVVILEDVNVKLVYIFGDLKVINFRKYFRKNMCYVFFI